MAKYDINIIKSLPGVLGNRENDIYFRRTGNKGHILSETGYKGNIGEQGIYENNFRFLENRETSLFISGEQGNGYPPRKVSYAFHFSNHPPVCLSFHPSVNTSY